VCHTCRLCVIRKASLRELDKAAELAIIGHSIGAFVSTLDAPHLKHLATNIVRDVTSWLVKLFRYSPLCVILLVNYCEVSTKMSDYLQVGKPFWYITSHPVVFTHKALMLARVLAMALCLFLCFCLSQVKFSRNGWMNRAGF